MLVWDKPDVVEGLVTYRDDAKSNLFYVMPNQPRFRIDDNGLPVFKFLKYRNPIDRPNGKKGGGFLIFDVEFSVPDDQLQKVTAKLQDQLDQQFSNTGQPAPQVAIGQLSYTRGAASLQFLDSGGAMVEKIQNPGSPSLYGKMITPFTVELSPEGATLAEAALQDKGGVVQVVYDLWTPVKLPPVTATIWFDAAKFMDFHQHVEIDWNMYAQDTYREQISEMFYSSESSGIEIDPGTVTDQKVLNGVRDWARASLDDAVKRMVLGDIAPVSEDQRKVPDGIDNLWRDVNVSKMASFRRTYREGQVMEWDPAPRGTLPNITTLIGRDGKPYKWEDFARTVDLDDAFFRTLNVNVRANADFDKLPLDSIEVKLEYSQGSEHSLSEYSLRSSNDVGKFASFIADNSYKYKYSYQVNYKGESQRYQSELIETDEQMLTVNVGDTGILDIDIRPGDINFTQVTQAQVTIQYEDQEHGVDLIEDVFTLDKDHQQARMLHVIFQPRRNPVSYTVKYTMANGKEYTSGPVKSRSTQLFINDPFSATRTVGLRGFGDFNSRIDSIFVDLKYVDDVNGYSQTKQVSLNKAAPFADWSFPVISETGGKIFFSYVIRLQNGSIEEQPEQETTANTILIGDVPREVSLLPNLIDWTRVSIVTVSLQYQDEANNINEMNDIIFTKDDSKLVKWTFSFKDKNKMGFTWKANYFMADGSSKETALQTTDGQTVVLPPIPA